MIDLQQVCWLYRRPTETRNERHWLRTANGKPTWQEVLPSDWGPQGTYDESLTGARGAKADNEGTNLINI